MLKYSSFAIALIAGLSACQSKTNIHQLKIAENGMAASNMHFEEENKKVYDEFQSRAKGTMYGKTTIWMPVANDIRGFSVSMLKHIDSLKALLKNYIDKDDKDIVKKIFETNGGARNLLYRLQSYKLAILNAPLSVKMDTMYLRYIRYENDQLRKKIPLLFNVGQQNISDVYSHEWAKINFTGSNPIAAVLVLDKLKSEVLLSENIMINDCLQYTNVIVESYAVFEMIAVLSSSYVKKGQPLEVSAGVGGFDCRTQPRISIDGTEIQLAPEHGCRARYKFIANGKRGKHSVKVMVEYTNWDGTRKTAINDLEYVIAD